MNYHNLNDSLILETAIDLNINVDDNITNLNSSRNNNQKENPLVRIKYGKNVGQVLVKDQLNSQCLPSSGLHHVEERLENKDSGNIIKDRIIIERAANRSSMGHVGNMIVKKDEYSKPTYQDSSINTNTNIWPSGNTKVTNNQGSS